jgi:hypothetical protein
MPHVNCFSGTFASRDSAASSRADEAATRPADLRFDDSQPLWSPASAGLCGVTPER